MTNDNQDALRCAELLEKRKILNIGKGDVCEESAAHLRRLVAENEAKDALLRQAVEALEQAKHNTTHGQIAWNCKEAITAIRQHLEGRA